MSTPAIHRMFGAAAVLSVISTLVTAHADTLPFTPTLTLGSTALINDEVHANADGSFTLIGEQQGGVFGSGFVWDAQWNLTVSQDPFISGSVSVTNLTTTTRNFSVAFSLPVAPSFSPSVFGGSIDGTVFDANGDKSAAMAPTSASPAIYRGTIDGNTVLSLFAMNLACSASVAGCSSDSFESDGLPGPTLSGPGVVSSIGTLLNFSVSAGDQATLLTNFTVDPPAPVPLPAALPLLLVGLGTLARARRRPEAMTSSC